MSTNLSNIKHKENEDDIDRIDKDKKIKEINNVIAQEKINKLLMNKENKEKRRKASKKKKGILNEKIINKETLIPPECTKIPYIPEKINNKQKTLVIDLDETLVHSYFEKEPPYKPDISFDIEITGIAIHISTLIRPGTYQFLEKLSNKYEIIIFTASLSQYAIPLLNEIDKNKYCKYTLFREHCYTFDNKGNPGYVKDLSKLNRDLNNTIIIDNNPDCYFLNKENGIPIKTWINDKNDKELFKLLPYLEFLANEYIIDVRPILTKIKNGKAINFKILDEIIESYKKTNNEINKKNDNNTTINENNSKTIESSNIMLNNKQYEEEKENENILNINNDKINEINKNIYQDKDILINNNQVYKKNVNKEEKIKNIIDNNNYDLKTKSINVNNEDFNEKELKEEKLNKASNDNNRSNSEKVKSFEYKENSVCKKNKSIKNLIINSLDKNHKKIFLKINEDRNLLNNIKCENIIKKNVRTIKNENIFNRHINIRINDNNNDFFFKNIIFNVQQKLNTNEKNALLSNESKEKKENILKIKLKEFDFKIKQFNIKLKNKEKDNFELKKNKYKNFNELNQKEKDDKNQINNKYNNFEICSDLLENKKSSNLNKKSLRKNTNKKDSTFKKDDKNSKDIYYFYKSKTMFNLSNKKGIDSDDKNSVIKKTEIIRQKRKNLSFFKKEINHELCFYSNDNHINNIDNIKNVNTKINIKKTKTNRKISEFDNIIYSKKFNSNKKESNKINLINNMNVNKKKNLHLKLPLTKRIIYSKFENNFYNKDKIISFMNKINEKISKKEKNQICNSRNNVINLQGLEQIKRLNFFNEKKRQGLSLGNVNKPTSSFLKIRPSYSSIE